MRSSGQEQEGRPRGGGSSSRDQEGMPAGRDAGSSSVVEHKEEDAHFEPVLPGPDEAQEAFSVGSRSGLPLSSSAPPMVGSRHSLPPGRRAARARPYLASEVQDRQQPRPSAFQRTFSERPEPLPLLPAPLTAPLTGLARLFLNRKDKAGSGQQESPQRKKQPPQPVATRGGTNGKWNSSPVSTPERAEKGMVGGNDSASLRELRARYISNAHLGGDQIDEDDDAAAAAAGNNRWAGQHDLDPVVDEDETWIEDIRAQDFLMKLAMALQKYGSPPPRTVALLAALAPRLGVEAQFYLFPNLLLCSFGINAAAETHMLRCPQDFDAFRFRKTSHLVQLMLTDEAFDDLQDEGGWETPEEDADPKRPRVRSLPEAVTKLDAIMNSPNLYPRAVQFLCQIASAVGGTFVFWRGGVWDAVVVAVTTFVVALLVFPGSDHFFIAKVRVLACSIATGVVSAIGSTYLETPCMRALNYAPVAFQLPGWGLSLSVLEFSVGAPILGTTRMVNALVSALLIGYGLEIGHAFVMASVSPKTHESMLPWGSSQNCEANPWWVQLAAFFVMSPSNAILMHAAPIQWPVMVLSAGGVIALKNGPLAYINEQLAVFLSALAIGSFGNIYGRCSASPALIVILFAVYMIVPGSMGVEAAASYLDKDPTSQGASTAVSMLFIACSIAAGLLVSQGLAVAVATVGGWCCAHGTAAMRAQHKERVRRRRAVPSHLGIDSVYF